MSAEYIPCIGVVTFVSCYGVPGAASQLSLKLPPAVARMIPPRGPNDRDEPQMTGESFTKRLKKRALSPVGSIALLAIKDLSKTFFDFIQWDCRMGLFIGVEQCEERVIMPQQLYLSHEFVQASLNTNEVPSAAVTMTEFTLARAPAGRQ